MESKHSLNSLLAPKPVSRVSTDNSLCDPSGVASEKCSGQLWESPPEFIGKQSCKTILTSASAASLRVLKTTLRFDDSLEGLTELPESSYAHGCGLLQVKDKDENQPSEEASSTQSEEGAGVKLLSPSLCGLRCVTFLALIGHSVHGVLLTRETHVSLGVQSLYWDSIS